jgi:inositol phosphorylceramide mannosyltransferase catalytic subunit
VAGDALRPFLLHAYGGLYLDMDVECLEPVDPTLQGFQLVLQMEDEGSKSLNNAVMASAPGHPLWLTMAHMLMERYVIPLRPSQKLWSWF